MGAGGFYYVNGNYMYGVVDHANYMGSSIPWASTAIAADAMLFMQLLGTSGASALGATEFAATAATPIIGAGLLTLTAASNTLGFGRPEDGERFSVGSEQFAQVDADLQTGAPPQDWRGDASATYQTRNTEQQQRAGSMATYDGQIQQVLADEAAVVGDARDFVFKHQTLLAAMIPAAIAAKAVPPAGPAFATAIEVAAVAATVPVALQRVVEMVSHSGDNADVIRQICSRYASVAEHARPPGSGGSVAGSPAPLSVPESLRTTADVHQRAAARIAEATSAADGSAGDVFTTHGVVCTSTATALRSAELMRRSAAEKMRVISTDLELALASAAIEYSGTEHQNAEHLAEQMPGR